MAVKGERRKIAKERKEAEARLDDKRNKGLAWQKKEIEEINRLRRDEAGFAERTLGIEEQINNIQDSILGKLGEKFSMEKAISTIRAANESGNKEEQESAKKYADLLAGVASGALDVSAVMAALANDGKDGLATFGPFSGAVEELIEMMGDMPDLGDKIKV